MRCRPCVEVIGIIDDTSAEFYEYWATPVESQLGESRGARSAISRGFRRAQHFSLFVFMWMHSDTTSLGRTSPAGGGTLQLNRASSHTCDFEKYSRLIAGARVSKAD
jgi:hypothetical protein